MRRVFLGIVAVVGLAVQPALAAGTCSSPADQALFEVQALRSALTILGLQCRDNDRYAAVVRRYQPDLNANAGAVVTWFRGRFGGRGLHEHDKFATEMDQAHAADASHLGGDFCPRNGAMFEEVMALRSGHELAAYAAGKDLIPAGITICPGSAAPVAVKRTGKK
jgi:hypothetical protein